MKFFVKSVVLFFAVLAQAQSQILPIETNNIDSYPETNSVTFGWTAAIGNINGYYMCVFTNATDFTNGVDPQQVFIIQGQAATNYTANLIQYAPGYLWIAMQSFGTSAISGWSNEIHWPAYPLIHVGDWITVEADIEQSGNLKGWNHPITNEVLEIYVPANSSNNFFRASLKNLSIKGDYFQPP